jgi:hypothetical protein
VLNRRREAEWLIAEEADSADVHTSKDFNPVVPAEAQKRSDLRRATAKPSQIGQQDFFNSHLQTKLLKGS